MWSDLEWQWRLNRWKQIRLHLSKTVIPLHIWSPVLAQMLMISLNQWLLQDIQEREVNSPVRLRLIDTAAHEGLWNPIVLLDPLDWNFRTFRTHKIIYLFGV